jgi:hypothetical protein
MLLQTLSSARRKLRPGHGTVARCLYRLASLSLRGGDRAAALGYLRQAAEAGFDALPGAAVCRGGPSCAWMGMVGDDGLESLRGDPSLATAVRR